jgi:hypothetical protein
MNPYLEQNDTGEDFHQAFITHARDWLSPRIGNNYLVKIEVRLYLHELSEEERRFAGRADAGVVEGIRPRKEVDPGRGLLVAPMSLLLPTLEVQRESFLEIRDRRDRRVVTVLELLSPANKTPGPDYEGYLGKRRSVLASQTHLVEIDLRRGGVRPQIPELPSCDYYVLASRYQERPKVGLWPISLRDRLPEIPIPLTPPDPDIPLDLQALLHQVYDAADYGKYIYAETPQPPLLPRDAEWAQSLAPVEAEGQTRNGSG